MPAQTRPYRLIEHTGDIRVRITGRSLGNLFQNSVFTLSDLLVDASKIRGKKFRRILVRAEATDLLLVRLLQEVLFLFDAKRFATRRLEFLEWTGHEISARAWGERLDPDRHRLKTEIKGVTMHQLRVGRRGARWFAEIVLDA